VPGVFFARAGSAPWRRPSPAFDSDSAAGMMRSAFTLTTIYPKRGDDMKRQAAMVLAAAVLLAGLSGCGASEREELKAKVASLEAQVTKLTGELATKDATLNELRAATDAAEQSAKQAQLQIDSVAAERDKLKAELNKLKKKSKKK